MRTIHIRQWLFAAFAVLVTAVSAAAQTKSPALLSALEVRQLIASTTPADQARLAAHFAALADQYTAEARRHESMAQGDVGNPSRTVTTSLSAHCKDLAKLNADAAATVRELEAHHKALAAGAPSVPPAKGAAFEVGAGAPEPNDQDLRRLAATAHTPADHQALAAYFLALAKRYTSEVADHSAMARAYRGLPRDSAGSAATHCDHLVTLSRAAAKDANAASGMHKELGGGER